MKLREDKPIADKLGSLHRNTRVWSMYPHLNGEDATQLARESLSI